MHGMRPHSHSKTAGREHVPMHTDAARRYGCPRKNTKRQSVWAYRRLSSSLKRDSEYPAHTHAFHSAAGTTCATPDDEILIRLARSLLARCAGRPVQLVVEHGIIMVLL